ncbi:hypothetical protein SAMN04490355_102614 [Pelosinus propionicus DSM 13327]|uniref:Uncharacterized protein n=1 Tax=Pelosinus propionicus DSM 13327 TaxID=1123291 RepID=A0A1I4LPT6_9FIRM|nr:hypothetical protein SAMN04490355_102614 [Pelosinus propionicus DSM 13327]
MHTLISGKTLDQLTGRFNGLHQFYGKEENGINNRNKHYNVYK